MPEISTKPYLLRAIYEWCTDNGFTPYLAAMVDGQTRVPREFVKDGEIVLNISFSATSSLKMDNDLIHFSARFGGVARDIAIPVENVVAIYARENGQGMAFDVARPTARDTADGEKPTAVPTTTTPTAPSTPTLSAVPTSGGDEKSATDADENPEPPDSPEPPKKGGKPTLTRIK
ncbi:MAG TPA: ClpXP protease specificity-enhancing factor [Burkholderiaceae bacterium]|jgi:stringent starvation protein B